MHVYFQLTFPSVCSPQPKICLSQFRKSNRFFIDLKHLTVERWNKSAQLFRREKMALIPRTRNLTLLQELKSILQTLLEELNFSAFNWSTSQSIVFDSLARDSWSGTFAWLNP